MRSAHKSQRSNGNGNDNGNGSDDNDDDEFESLGKAAMSGMGTHVIYNVEQPVSIKAQESAVVHVATRPVAGQAGAGVRRKRKRAERRGRPPHEHGLGAGQRPLHRFSRGASRRVPPADAPGDDELLPIGLDDSVSVEKSEE